jgi:hypothetical protein
LIQILKKKEQQKELLLVEPSRNERRYCKKEMPLDDSSSLVLEKTT